MNKISKTIIIFFFLASLPLQTTVGQQSKIYQLGKALLTVAKSQNPEEITNYFDKNLSIDKKAEILESFLNIKEYIFNDKDLKLFNVVKTPDNTFFIFQTNNDYVIIKSKTNNQQAITGTFSIEKPNLAKRIKNGQKIYKLQCYSCHKKEGIGEIGPNLADSYWKFVNSEKDLHDIIANGRKGTMMIAFKSYLTPEQIKDVMLYIKALQGKKNTKWKKPEGEKKNLNFIFK